VEGSHDQFLWTALEARLGPVAERLGWLQEWFEMPIVVKTRAYTNALNHLLRLKLFALTMAKFPGCEPCPVLTFGMIDDRVLSNLQKAVYAVSWGMPKRMAVPRDPLMEERDRMIYEEVCDGTKTYAEIRRMIRDRYPSSSGVGYLHVSVGRICQIAWEFAERHRLRKPPRRHQRPS
jgi:hypothetical protein